MEWVRSLQQQGRWDESIAALRQLIDEGDRTGEVMYRYGAGLAFNGLPGRGMWALEVAVKDPEWLVLASHQLASDAYQSGNQDLTLEILERLAANRTDDHNDDLHARVLELRVRTETRRQYEESLLLAEEILDDFPDEMEVTRLKAAALLGLKETDAAFELIKSAGVFASDIGDGDKAGGTVPGEAAADGSGEIAGAGADERDHQDAYWCLVRSTFRREAAELVEADTSITECLEKYPSNTGLIDEAVKLYSALKDFDRISDILETAHEADPDNKEIRIAWVRLLDNLGRTEDAENVLRESLSRAEGQPAPPRGPNVNIASKWVDLGAFLVDNGSTNDGLDAYDEALKILGEFAAPSLLFQHAEGLIRAERFDEALAIADRTPIEVHPPMIRGRVAFELGEYEKSIEELRDASLQWPDNAPIHYYLARAFEGVGDFDNAIEEYRQAIRSDPTLSAARERLAKLHISEGRIRQAGSILEFRSALKESTPSGAMHLLDVEVKARLGLEPNLTLPPAADLSIDEMRRGAVASLARGLRAGGDAASTETILSELQSKLADAPSQGHFLRARVGILLDAGQTERAIEIARAASKMPFATADVGIALGHALVAANQSVDEAKDLLTRAIALYPTDLETLTALGDIARLGGDAAGAAHYYDQALTNDPAFRPAFEARLRQLRDQDDASGAAAFLSEYVHRHNPYDGLAALELAQTLGASDDPSNKASNKADRVKLAKRAIRFGAGKPAIDWLGTIDADEAAKYAPTDET